MKSLLKSLFPACFLFAMLPAATMASDKTSVFVSIIPQKYFVEQIGGDLVDVEAMVKPGSSPHSYEPTPRQLTSLANAKIYFAIGVPFENGWLGKIASTNPDMTIVHTDDDVKKRRMAAHHHEEAEEHGDDEHHHAATEHHDEHEHDMHDHHAEAEHHEHDTHDGHKHEDDHHSANTSEHHNDEAHEGHDQEGLDPHIWLSPALVKIQAAAILSGLQQADPNNADTYQANFDSFINNINQLDADLKHTFADQNSKKFMVFHPSWGYFADAYGLQQIPVEMEGKEPSPKQLQAIIQEALEEKIKVVFVQPQFSKRSAEVIAKAIGGNVSIADPLAEDWETNLREIGNKFQKAAK